jgi:hypothetical protein
LYPTTESVFPTLSITTANNWLPKTNFRTPIIIYDTTGGSGLKIGRLSIDNNFTIRLESTTAGSTISTSANHYAFSGITSGGASDCIVTWSLF